MPEQYRDWTHLILADSRVERERIVAQGQVHWRIANAPVEPVCLLEKPLKLVFCPYVVVPVPQVDLSGIDLELEARDDAEVVPGPLHAPKKVGMASLVDPNRGAVGQHDVELDDVVAYQSVQAFVATVTAPEAGSHHPNAVTTASS